jgi:ketosteroid isomerase-like protein
LVAALMGATAGGAPNEDALLALAEAERAFARQCVCDGVRASFLAHFADDGIVLAPVPANAQALYSQRPAPAQRPPVTLDWEPTSGDVAASGEPGWTTGPYTRRDDEGREPTAHGHYFSVWRRRTDGTWKVVGDAGTENPAPNGARAPFARASGVPATTGQRPLREQLFDLDREAGQGCAAGDCLAERLDADARVHRPGRAPWVGADAAGRFLKTQAPRSFEPEGGEAATSGDLAWTFGRYRERRAAGAGETGGYIHVWRRTAQGWRLAAEVAKPETDR